MKQIKHHLNDGLLMGYASGNLPEAFSLVVATHISLCDECRARLESFDAIGGVLIDEDAAVEMTATALEATFERIAVIHAVPKTVAPPKTAVLPKPLQDYVGEQLSACSRFQLAPLCPTTVIMARN